MRINWLGGRKAVSEVRINWLGGRKVVSEVRINKNKALKYENLRAFLANEFGSTSHPNSFVSFSASCGQVDLRQNSID